jgi:uncharacterized protein DUF5343
LAKDLPYLKSYKNVGVLFDKIEKAKIPEVFNLSFLSNTIGLKSSGDRQLISLLKKLGFLDNAGKPTSEYNLLKNKTAAKTAISKGIRHAFAPLFAADESAHELPNDQLKGLIAQVSGADEAMIKLIAGTFNSLAKVATIAQLKVPNSEQSDNEADTKEVDDTSSGQEKQTLKSSDGWGKFNPDFRFNIEIHLPSNGTEETYLAIFNALRKSLG